MSHDHTGRQLERDTLKCLHAKSHPLQLAQNCDAASVSIFLWKSCSLNAFWAFLKGHGTTSLVCIGRVGLPTSLRPFVHLLPLSSVSSASFLHPCDDVLQGLDLCCRLCHWHLFFSSSPAASSHSWRGQVRAGFRVSYCYSAKVAKCDTRRTSRGELLSLNTSQVKFGWGFTRGENTTTAVVVEVAATTLTTR